MSRLRERLDADLAMAGLAPLHRLGQNFMIDPSALDCLVETLGATAGSRVVEIGPGTGHLTERLLDAGCTVLAVELDRGLHGFLDRQWGGRAPAFQLVHGDCLESKNRLHPAIEAFAQQPWSLGSNLPYDVSLPVLLNAVALPNPPQRMAVTVQYEAAQRLCSKPGDDAWGASAAVLQSAGVPALVRRLTPSCFFPQPRVDSAILSWRPGPVPVPPGFGRWCRTMFSARRKVLVRALRDAGHEREPAEGACQACGLDTSRRVEGLDASELVALYRTLGPLGDTAAHERTLKESSDA